MSDNFEPRTRSNKGWIVVIVIFLGMAYLFIQEAVRTGKVKDVFAAPAATAAPAVRAEVIRAEPTIDYQSRIEAANSAEMEARALAVIANERANSAEAAAIAAQVAAKQIDLERDKVSLELQNAKVREAEAAVKMEEQKNKSALLKIEQDKVNAEKTPAAIQNTFMAAKAEQDIKYGEKKAQADIFFKTALPVVIGLLALTLLGWLIWTFLYARYIASQPVVEPAAEAPYRPVVALHEHKDGIDSIKQIHPPLCDDETFREWAGRMLSNDSAAINLWEVAGSPFSKQNYPSKYYRRVFYPWLIANLLVEIETGSGRLVLSDRGEMYCADWLIRNPTHSPDDEVSPKSASTPAMSMETMPMDGRGRGFTPMSEPFPGS